MLIRLPPSAEGGSMLDTSKVPVSVSAEDQNYLGWTYDPAQIQSSTIGSAGLLYINKVKLPGPLTVTNVHLYVGTAGATLTSGQCFAMLYAPNGVLLGQTATQHTAWTTTGLKNMALTTPQFVQWNSCYVGFYSTGTTQPAFARASSGLAAAINAGLVTPNLRFASASTALTTAPPNPFLATQTATANAYWAAVS